MKNARHYKNGGALYTGKTHKHADGTLMTGAAMSKSSTKLSHYKDLSKAAKGKVDGAGKKSKKP